MKKKLISLIIIIFIFITSTSVLGVNSSIEKSKEDGIFDIISDSHGLGLIYKEIPNHIPRTTFKGDSPYNYFDWRDAILEVDGAGNKIGKPGNGSGYDWTTSVKDQGECGSCYAFGSLGALESVIMISENNPNLDIDLSEQFMVSCGSICYIEEFVPGQYLGMKGCFGSPFSTALNFILEQGAFSEDYFKYVAKNSQCGAKEAGWNSNLYKISDWRVVEGGDNSIKNALIEYGPLSTTMTCYENFKDYDGGIYAETSGESGGHMILLVGWDDINQCWICKNSWGEGWGEKNPYDPTSSGGWFRIGYGVSDINRQIAYFTGPYIEEDHNAELGLSKNYETDENDRVLVRFDAIKPKETAFKEDALEITNDGEEGSILNWRIYNIHNGPDEYWISDYSFNPSSGYLESGETQSVDMSFRPVQGYGLDHDRLTSICIIENTDNPCVDFINFKVILTINHVKTKNFLLKEFFSGFELFNNIFLKFL